MHMSKALQCSIQTNDTSSLQVKEANVNKYNDFKRPNCGVLVKTAQEELSFSE
jgi:hypothetical protein